MMSLRLSILAASLTLISLPALAIPAPMTSYVYYKASVKNWTTVNMHFRVGTGAWTTVPGEPMQDACVAGGVTYKKKALTAGTIATEAAFNNGTSWDNQGNKSGQNYLLMPSVDGSVTVVNGDGSMTAGVTDPCASVVIGEILPPSQPVLATKFPVNQGVSLSWLPSTDNVGVVGYRVYRDGIQVATVTNPAYVDNNLVAGCSYVYTVVAFDAAGNDSLPSIGGMATAGGLAVTPFDSFDEFVKQQYRDFFGREGDAAGVAAWVADLNAGKQTRASLIQTFMGSAEFQAKAAPITRLYKAYFKRMPDHEGLWYWVGLFGNGKTVADISQTFSDSPEFKAAYGSLGNSAFIDLVYQNVLGRAGDAAGKAYWLGLLDTGKQSRGDIMIGFSESAEHVSTSSNHLNLVLAYEGLLRRNVSAADYAAAMARLTPGTPMTTIIGELIGGGEYRDRFVKATVCPVPNDGKPTPPTNLLNTKTTPTEVSLSWSPSNAAKGIVSYSVFRNGVNIATVAQPEVICAAIGCELLRFTDTALNPGTNYVYTIVANDAAGQTSAMSAALTVHTPTMEIGPDLLPTVPSNLQAIAQNANSINLSWTASTDDKGVVAYYVYRDGVLATTTTATSLVDMGGVACPEGTVCPPAFAPLQANTSYTYTIKAKDTIGQFSGLSVAVTAKTKADSPIANGSPLGTDMREDSIYFVMTARFFDGDPANNRGGALHKSSGNEANNDPMFRGDFKGLMQKLDYIKAMGFSAIWITPVVLNRSEYDFHGYHGYDFYRVDPRLESTGASYQDLINAAHAKGIKIIQDVVYNHSSKFGAKGLSTAKYFGKRDTQWSGYYDAPNPSFEYDGLTPEPNSGKAHYNGDTWSESSPEGNTCTNWGVATGKRSAEGYSLYGCQWTSFGDKNSIGMFNKDFFHACWLGNWEGEDAKSCWIHGDLPDLNTENKTVQDYLIGAYNKYIDMGVDGFRIDTMVHVHRNMWNKHFLPAAIQHSAEKFGAKGQNFYMVGEVGAFVNDKWNHGSPGHSPQFYTWKERKEYSADDAVAVHEMTAYEQAATQPTSTNAFLAGNDYHTPDLSKCNGASVIDMRMHMNFGDAGNAFSNGKDSDDSYCDASYNMVYVDSHDFGPGKSSTAYAGGTNAWAENMSLMWTFRGIPTLYMGSEIEFQAGKQIDCGGSCPLSTTRRAYFGANIEGSVTASDFGVSSGATGALATTMDKPLVKHLQRLNQIRRKIPALQKGQYSTEGVSGGIAYKRRFTNATTDSFAVVAVSSTATFSGIPNGTYTDAVTGDVKTVSNGSLTATVSGQGNLRVYVLSTAKTPAPGKIGEAGPFLK